MLAIEHGDAFAATVSGVNLANNLSQLNDAGSPELDGAAGALGTVASALNLYSALESGDAGGIIVSGASLLNVVASEAISNAIGMAFSEVVPVLGILNSLAHGDVLGAAISAVAMAFPVAGAVLMVANMVFGGLFGGDEDIPTSYGDAQAQWDAAGLLSISTTRDEAGGGATAAGWMNSLLGGLTNELASRTDANGQPLYGLDPSRLPRIGYAYDPDTSEGYLRLSWTAADGTLQYRQYDTRGSRHDVQTQAGVNDLARDFLEHAADAIVPAWEAQTLFQQQGSTAPHPTAAFTGELSADGAHVTRTVLTLGSGSSVTTALDWDRDGYLEHSGWTTAALLAVDLDGNGQVSADELVDGRAAAGSRNSLAALDANGDGVLDSRDPGLAALSLWIDANGNGLAEAGEVSAAAASIAMIAFTHDAITVTRSDGTTSTLTRSELTGDTQGVRHALTQDGLYAAKEGGDTTLYALNQHTFDGEAAHQHGGEANPDAHGEIVMEAGDARIHSLGSATAASRAVQTTLQGDALLQSAGAGAALRGQAAGSQAGAAAPISVVSDTPTNASATAPNAPIRINPGDLRVQSAPPTPVKPRDPIVLPPGLAFVPKATTNPGRAIEQVTADMIASATGGLFSTGAPLAAIACAALPLAFPAVASAAQADPDSLAAPPARPGSLTDALLLNVLAGRRYDDKGSPTPGTLPITWSAAVVTSHAAGDSGVASARPPTDAGALPTQLLTDWRSAAAAAAPPSATPASQTLGLADWVSVPSAQQAAGAAATGSSIQQGGTGSSDTPPAPQTRPLGALLFINHAPDVQGEQASSPEDTALIISAADLLANDSDPDGTSAGQTLTLTAVGHATHGSVSLIDGQILFTPEADYFGPAGFDYTVSDRAGGESVARFALDVQPVNDAPRALGESAASTEDTRLLIAPTGLLANDSDIDNAHGDLRIATLADAHHGTVTWTVGPDGQPWLAFTPDANFHGDADFTYTVSDGAGGETTATATLNITSVNDLPLATGETATGSEDLGILFTAAQLLANEVDADGDPLSIVRVGNSQNGTVSMNEQGDVSFLPHANYHGPAGFDYWVNDGQGGEAQAHVAINLASVNDAPVAENTILGSHAEDAAILINGADLLRNANDIDSPTLTITAVSNALHGAVERAADGTIRFIPDADYNGPAGFRYTVSDGDGGETTAIAVLTVTAVDDAPVAHGETASGDEDHELVFPAAALLANDTDGDKPYGDHLTLIAVELVDPTVGHARIAEDGSVRFTPNPDYAGPAALLYQVSDSTGLTSTATLTLTVLPVNDAPLVHDEALAGTEDTALQFDPALLLANDRDVDNAHAELSISALGAAQHGTVRWHDNAAGPSIEFTPDADYSGEAGFAYTVADSAGGKAQGYVTVNVANVNDAPVANDDNASGLEDTPLRWSAAALTGNDIDADRDSLSIAAVGNACGGTVALIDNQVIFTPDADYSGPGGFDYTTSDGHGGMSSAHVALEIAAVNDAPTVVGETIQGVEETPLDIDPAALLANDNDVDSPLDSLHLVAVGGAHHGTVTQLPDGMLHFVPETDFTGDASFDYTVADDAGATRSGSASIHIANVNDAPVATGETITSAEDDVLILKDALLANDTDVDTPHAALGVSAIANPKHCTVEVNRDGSVTFRPDANYSGPAAFDYTVSDGAGGYATARANFVITPVNDAPLVTSESASTHEDSIIHFSAAALLANDTDIETPGSLNIVSLGAAYGGWVDKAGDDITFTPYQNFNGAASFSYNVADPDGGLSQGRVNINYAPVNDAPVVNNEIFHSRQNVTTTLSEAALLQNDDDDGGRFNLQVSSAYNAYGGTLTYTDQNGVVFQPDSGFSGIASFYYTVADSEGASSSGYAQIDFSKPNNNPIATDDSFSGDEDVVFNISTAQLLANDSDADDPGKLAVTAVSAATHGTVRLDSTSNTVIFTPDANYNGAAQFNYTVADPYGGSAQATAFLDIKTVNDAPVIDRVEWNAVDARERDWTAINNDNNIIETHIGEHIDDPYRASGRIVAHDPDADGATLNYSITTAPTHGKAWANQYTSADYAPRQDDQGNYYGNPIDNLFLSDGGTTPIQWAWVYETGTWQYYSMRGDPYTGPDPFTLRVTDAQGAYTDVSIATSHLGTSINTGGGGGCPVVLDLNNNGIELLAPEDSSTFTDLNGDGWKDQIGWVAPNDGVLAYDANRDGLIDVLDEVSFVKYKDGARTDLEGLAGLDSSGDGIISSADDAWSKLGVVTGAARQDSTGKVSDWSSLDSNGIAAISLERQGTPYLDHGNVVFGTSTLTFADGHTSQAGDVMFAGAGIPLPDEALAALEPTNKELAANEGCVKTGDVAAVGDSSSTPATDIANTPCASTTPQVDDCHPPTDLSADAFDPTTPSPAVTGSSTGEPASTEDDISPEAANEIARIRQQALLFNQASATATPDTDPAVLAYVPPQSDASDTCTTAVDMLVAPASAEPAHI
ncbi:cadherin-like domain-containing protein [Zoogloea sp.]|uniref:cadherin-like domain-containing protein n=1 Tax=Zoogloea sp. TaxID=49181 RepID=UPI0031FE2E6E